MSHHLGDRAGGYVDGVLDPAEAARARAHLESCETCREKVAEQERVRQVLRGASDPEGGPPPALLAALASMPVSGPPATAASPGPVRAQGDLVRRAAISCVALGATLLATAYAVGGPATAQGPPAVPPANLAAQHLFTAGQLPFWGAAATSSEAALSATSAKTGGGSRRTATHERLAEWLTRNPSSILRRAATASSSVSYRALEQVTTYDGGAPVTRVAEVSHISGRGTSTRVLGGDLSTTDAAFQPEVLGQQSSSLDAIALLERTYSVSAEGVDLVAGRRVDRVAVSTRDGQVVARFWIDRASGLPLARETRTSGGESTWHRMTAVTLAGTAAMPAHLPVAASAVWAEAVGIPATVALEVLDAEGWVCPEGLGAAIGLQPFDVLVTDADASGSKGQVLHIIYTDGLRSVSVFQQRATLSKQRLVGFDAAEVGGAPVYRRDGQPSELTWAAAGMVFTVVGDVPEPLLDTVVAELPHEREGSGARTARGLARVGSWIDPFG